MSAQKIRFGLDTFGDITLNDDGSEQTPAQTLRNVVEQAVLAEQVGLDNFNIGEHHRDDFAVSAPDTVLAGISTRTSKITLGSGVTVLSSEDPIRVYQRFATLDALSNGRAEITAGRGSFTESFPLFGFELSSYAVLFEEKLELLVELLKEKPVTWSGTIRPALVNQQVYPKTERGAIPLRVGVGGSPESVVRAARHNASLALAIIGGDPARFLPYARLYEEQMEKFGNPIKQISIHSPGHISLSDENAMEELWPGYESSFGRIGRERGWGPMSKGHFVEEVQHGSLYVGSPETVAQKIAYAIKAVGANRFDLKFATGPMKQSTLMQSIELYGKVVAPRVREILASQLVG